MADRPVYPSRFMWCVMAIYSAGCIVPFAIADKAFWVFAVACAGAIPLGIWLARRDQRVARFRGARNGG